MHNIFYVSLREYDTTREDRVDKQVTELELEAGDSKEYKLEAIRDSAVYASKWELGQLPSLYYLIVWKGYLMEKNIWEPLLVVHYLKKLISCFHMKHPEKPTANFPPINSFPPMVNPTVRPTPLKWK